MTEADVAVIGAGPAGASAALAADAAGASVVLLDEAPAPGGQIWRAPPPGWPAPKGPDGRAGEALRQSVMQSAVRLLPRCEVWSVLRERDDGRFRIDALQNDAAVTVTARALVVANGTSERVVPFPGWTRPGVTGLAAATVLLKSFGMVPGQRVVVAGSGPLLMAVAAGVLDRGGKVAAVVDTAARADWAASLPALARRPRLLLRGAQWRARVLAAGVPVFHRSSVVRARGTDVVEAVDIARIDASGVVSGEVQTLEADALTIGHGLSPATELTRLLGATHTFERALGGWRPVVDEWGRTSVTNLFAAGDGTGVLGADAATQSGARAGAAAAGINAAPQTRMLRHAAAVGRAMSSLTAVHPARLAALADEVVVCRCEDVTAGMIRQAITDGAGDLNQIKHFTRCGMGPCQGRICADIVGDVAATHRCGTSDTAVVDPERERLGQWTGRVPLRPIPLVHLVGSFQYADIPVPAPAPL